MNASTDASVKAIWAAIFVRKGGPGSDARLWDEWDDERRAAILKEIQIENGELPVLLFNSPQGSRVILTTRRLIHGRGAIPIAELMEVKPAQFTEKEKHKLEAINVVLGAGETVRIEWEAGAPYFGLWNVLLHIAKRNARKSG